jgi:hypothetical protein
MKKNKIKNPLQKFENEINNLDSVFKKEKLILLKKQDKISNVVSQKQSNESLVEMKLSLQKLVKELKNKSL